MFNNNIAKYKGLFISVSSFVVFFVAYLALNTVIQNQAFKELQFAETLRNTQQSILNSTDTNETQRLLNTIQNGGDVRLAAGQVYSFDPIDTYLAPEKGDVRSILQALTSPNLAVASKRMETLVEKVDEKVARKLKLTTSLQIVAGMFTVILYFIVLIPVLLRISKTDDSVKESTKETEGILSTVGEGLFLLDADYNIGVQQSASLKEMFKSERDLEGDFFYFIGQYVTQSTVQVAKDYMDLLFGDRVKEKLVQDLNPLKRIEINIIRRDGSYENRYLDFKFNRIVEGGKLSHLLGSVTDITRQVELEQQLADGQDAQEAQLNLLMSILHIDAAQLRLFFTQSSATLNSINNTFESGGSNNVTIRHNLLEISRETHRIKGDAAALGLSKFEFLAHEFEEELDRVKATKEALTGKQLLPTVTKLRELFAELDNMRSLVDKFAESFSGASSSAIAPVEIAPVEIAENGIADDSVQSQIDASDAIDLTPTMLSLVETVAERNDRQVQLNSEGFTSEHIPEHLLEAVKDISVQLLRNCVVHGAETTDEREQLGKTPWLNINANFVEKDSRYELIIRDDGYGLNPEKIIARALKLNLISSQTAAGLPPQRAVGLLFMPGFSNIDEANLDGGRGVGLDAVRDMVKQHQGKVNVQFQVGVYSQFRISFPKAA